MNVADLLILAGVGLLLFSALRRIRANRKKGGCSCGCQDCGAACAMRKTPEEKR